jgi:hypothetical protein
MKTLAQDLIKFYAHLAPPALPKHIEILHPQPNQQVMDTVKRFFLKFYPDNKPRRLMLGINPVVLEQALQGLISPHRDS